MNNINTIEKELKKLKDNLHHEIVLSVLILICSILGAYILFGQTEWSYRGLASIILIFGAYLRNTLFYDAAHKELAFFWERILHKSSSDVRVKRFLDNNYEDEAFLYLNKNEKGYSRKKKWNSIIFYK